MAIDDILPLVLWTSLFMSCQGYLVNENCVFQGNKSAILLEKNGKKSSGKCTRALNISYFALNDHMEKDTISIKYIPTSKMIGDYMSKGLQGIKFHKFCDKFMGHAI